MYLIVALQLSGCRFDTLSNWNNDDGEAMGAAKHIVALQLSGCRFDTLSNWNNDDGEAMGAAKHVIVEFT
ncbi:transducin family protein / WD-40 repeat family protein [Prunus dulcis]|uniref:Transducin family protein / WD-40 repeat family protein n=1 Tax=Prunus dulcis TaxID=3755 RepID=A0A4Y1QQL9_PRUDU|nr:transducin family protein / WD-40 repeat family protein [Prunus dulcis]